MTAVRRNKRFPLARSALHLDDLAYARGTLLQVLKQLGGMGTMEMVQRYAHLSADHLPQWMTPMTAAPTPVLAAISLQRDCPTERRNR
ncbi:protein of unknown function [Burkholderia multivorans]